MTEKLENRVGKGEYADKCQHFLLFHNVSKKKNYFTQESLFEKKWMKPIKACIMIDRYRRIQEAVADS